MSSKRIPPTAQYAELCTAGPSTTVADYVRNSSDALFLHRITVFYPGTLEH
ncbi:Hypothetical protein PP7435_CHR4-2148 [Komagataella phaffii CBS 7435]|uniref:Uncharacterized protein n=1 Tax=Komagataella phaffii (strain ATCC 76273 / CBS 7435 / CECT 11047 / NRRL Y-11430 / Wegner 21-1) TaxID=981350 RepID=A0A1G4KR26_KOMPC|nr:Hypothetical protein BQ9382_C4-5328 [Komagataella phaffii CBS 7435]SCV12443.1 Hypothetical protein PP7435_CHR4-2148 [Komagataella phaffii CBS 7435]